MLEKNPSGFQQEVEKRKPTEIEQNTLALNKVYPQGKLVNQRLIYWGIIRA